MASKRKPIEDLIERMDIAIEREFYFETAWIAYGIIEDRTNSALKRTSGGQLARDRNGLLPTINKRLQALKERASTDAILKKVNGFASVVQLVIDWKNKRNDLVHALIDTPRNWADINEDAKELAIEGREVVSAYNARIMKQRKKFKKQS